MRNEPTADKQASIGQSDIFRVIFFSLLACLHVKYSAILQVGAQEFLGEGCCIIVWPGGGG